MPDTAPCKLSRIMSKPWRASKLWSASSPVRETFLPRVDPITHGYVRNVIESSRALQLLERGLVANYGAYNVAWRLRQTTRPQLRRRSKPPRRSKQSRDNAWHK